MGLKYADVCKECGMRKTRHPSGLCCRCRLTGPKSTCKFCGARTRNGHDCCYRCRKFQKVSLDYDAAKEIAHSQIAQGRNVLWRDCSRSRSCEIRSF